MSNVVVLDKNWWKQTRVPSSEIVIQKKKKKLADQYFSLNRMAKRFDCGYDLLYKAVRRNELDAEFVGRAYRVTEEAVERYLELCKNKKRFG